jgi:WD40 repeat protein
MRVVADGKWYGAPAFARQHDALITLRPDGIRFWRRDGPLTAPSVIVRRAESSSWSGPIQFSPDDRLGVFGDHLLDLTPVWDAFARSKTTRLEPAVIPITDPEEEWVDALVLDPSGERVFVQWGEDLALWDLSTRQRRSLWRTSQHWRTGQPAHPAVSPDGRLVAADTVTLGRDGFRYNVDLVDVERGKVLATLPHSNWLQTLAFSPRPSGGGHLLATATRAPSKVRLWDVASRTCVAEFKALPGSAVGMCFHPSGRFLLAAGRDGQIRCYDTLTFRETERLDWQLGKLQGLAISPDGLTAAVVGQQRGVLIWDLDDLLPM